jgi:hypothetical protein
MSSARDGSVLRGAYLSAVAHGVSPHPGREEQWYRAGRLRRIREVRPVFSEITASERRGIPIRGAEPTLKATIVFQLCALWTHVIRVSPQTCSRTLRQAANCGSAFRWVYPRRPSYFCSQPLRSRWILIIPAAGTIAFWRCAVAGAAEPEVCFCAVRRPPSI